MLARSTAIALLLVAAATVDLGCARAHKLETRAPVAPPTIRDLDDFALALNDFTLMADDDPSRPGFREALARYLVRYINERVAADEHQEALTALQFATALYTPGELRRGPDRDPELAAVAHKIYLAAARRGNEQPALFALAVEQQFGDDKTRARAIAQWQEIEDWVLRNAHYADQPLLRHEELQEAMYETAAVFPAPFVVKRLSDLYLARHEAAVRLSDSSSALGMEARRRAEFSSYLLARLYLRADDLPGAIRALGELRSDDVVARRGGELIQEALDAQESAVPLLVLAEQFKPDAEEEANVYAASQLAESWGIVENLARRAVRKFPKDADAHLLYARSLRQSGLIKASIVHFEAAIALREDTFDAWRELAELKQTRLERVSDRSAEQALAMLADLEKFHARAVELWRDRPIRPGMPEANFTVSLVLYNAGKIDKSRALLQKSLAAEPMPETLDLLATIEQKSNHLDRAEQHLQALLGLPFEHQLLRLRWETRARTGLAELALARGDRKESERQLHTALRELNTIIAFPGLSDEIRSARLVERGKLLFRLGDVEQCVADFRQARGLTPNDTAVYAEPMLFIVSHGYYREALEIYKAALANDALRESLKLYFSLWINELALRQGQDVDADALEFVHSFKGDSWPRKLALHAQGKVTFDQLINDADDPGEQAEAYFYEGLRRWRTGNVQGGKEMMQKVISTEMMGFFEYDMARSYLAWDDLPTHERPAASTSSAQRK
ncbi:MAG: hypothetical protein KC636_29450 [Myxococcales bacterium]|nr:hypothetical protein [Myxococcales bacterium]